MTLTKQQLIEEEQIIGTNIEEAVYILTDGTSWDGQFDCGCRGVEHREVESFTKYDRYDGEKFWKEVTVTLGLVMLVPESKMVLIHPEYTVTDKQQKQINKAVKLGYEVSDFN